MKIVIESENIEVKFSNIEYVNSGGGSSSEFDTLNKIPNGVPIVDATGNIWQTKAGSQLLAALGIKSAALYEAGNNSGQIPIVDNTGKLDSSILPALTTNNVYSVLTIAERDLLPAVNGDVAIVSARGDGEPDSYIYNGSGWLVIEKPLGGIISVNSKTGTAIILNCDDIAETATRFYYTLARFVSDFNSQFASKTTDNLTEGTTNKFMNVANVEPIVNAILSGKTTDDISEGTTNLYYLDSRVADWFATVILNTINFTDARAVNSSTDISNDKSFATVDYVKSKTANAGGTVLFLETDIC